MDCYKAALQWE